MSSAAESIVRPIKNASEPELTLGDQGSDRRADVDAKQTRVAALLQDAGCDGLLVTDPENFAWLTSGATVRGALDPDELPCLYFSPEGRWLLSSNVDSQRTFDEEMDELGFQLKEWPWHWGREQLLADLCQGRRLACDRPLRDWKPVGDVLRKARRALTVYEQACYRALGAIVGHALEATCRTMPAGITEREVAGQLSHRLVHRGAQVVTVGVAADGRSRLYRQFGFTATAITKYALLTVAARKYGLVATASRAVAFGEPDPQVRQEQEAVCKIGATYLASTWPDALPSQILGAGRRVYQISGFEHEWRHCPQGHVTGRSAVELALTPATEELFQAGWAVTWRISAGAASGCDTFLITDKGPELLTPTEVWPLKRIRIQGADFLRPDVLQR
jgi:Xaa-Pro aminopeptidase